jgi:hypothetical protein
VKIKGVFEETQAVIANDEEAAKEKARKRLGETIDLKAIGDLEILGIKPLESEKSQAGANTN